MYSTSSTNLVFPTLDLLKLQQNAAVNKNLTTLLPGFTFTSTLTPQPGDSNFNNQCFTIEVQDEDSVDAFDYVFPSTLTWPSNLESDFFFKCLFQDLLNLYDIRYETS